MENADIDIWTQVIEIFKGRPHMWDKKHPKYFNRDLRRQGLDLMYTTFKELKGEEEIDFSHFKKKFENMRTSFARELKKVNASKQTGSGRNDLYMSSLWYYDLFTFLKETNEPTRKGKDTLEYIEFEIPENTDNNEVIEVNSEVIELPSQQCDPPVNTQCETIIEEFTTPNKKQRMSLQRKQSKLLDTAQKLLTTKTDDWEVIGKAMALQLKTLNPQQQIVAQKLISDVIYYGKLEKLTVETKIDLNTPVLLSSSTVPITSYQQCPIQQPLPQYQQQLLPYQNHCSIPMSHYQYQVKSPIPSQPTQNHSISSVPTQPTHHSISSVPTQPTQNHSISSVPTEPTHHSISSVPTEPTHHSISSVPTEPTHHSISSVPTQPTQNHLISSVHIAPNQSQYHIPSLSPEQVPLESHNNPIVKGNLADLKDFLIFTKKKNFQN